jgi:hypothetical protein
MAAPLYKAQGLPIDKLTGRMLRMLAEVENFIRGENYFPFGLSKANGDDTHVTNCFHADPKVRERFFQENKLTYNIPALVDAADCWRKDPRLQSGGSTAAWVAAYLKAAAGMLSSRDQHIADEVFALLPIDDGMVCNRTTINFFRHNVRGFQARYRAGNIKIQIIHDRHGAAELGVPAIKDAIVEFITRTKEELRGYHPFRGIVPYSALSAEYVS